MTKLYIHEFIYLNNFTSKDILSLYLILNSFFCLQREVKTPQIQDVSIVQPGL